MRGAGLVACSVAALVSIAGADDAAPTPAPGSDPYAVDPDAPVPAPDEARGWERAPEPAHVAVLGPLARGLQRTGRYAVALVAGPFRGAAWLEDRHRVFTRTRDLFYNDAHTAGLLPAITLESGFGAQLGATVFHKDALGHHELVAASATYGGENRYGAQAKLEIPHLFADRAYLLSRLRYEATDNLLFAGIGNPGDPDAFAPAGDTRYGERRVLGTASAGVQRVASGRRLRVGMTYIYNDREFDEDVRAGSTPIGERYDVANLRGFVDGVHLNEITMDVDLDARDRRGATGSGLHATAFYGVAFGDDARFSHWGGELTGYVTPWRERRVFVVRLVHEGVEGRRIPFTEQPRLGGAGLLRGYARDQFRDELSEIATLEYRYPIQSKISGTVFVETGKVGRSYDALLENFGDDWHVGYGGGLIVHARDSIALTVQLAYGDGLQLYATTDVWQAFKKRAREL